MTNEKGIKQASKSINLPEDLWNKLDAEKIESDMSRSKIIKKLLVLHYEKNNDPATSN